MVAPGDGGSKILSQRTFGKQKKFFMKIKKGKYVYMKLVYLEFPGAVLSAMALFYSPTGC